MAAEPNTGYNYQHRHRHHQQQAISIGNSSNTKDMIATGCYYNTNIQGDSVVLDSVAAVVGVKDDSELSAEWGVDEQYRLEEGLMKYTNEPNIMKYVKIAATLRDKNVRDVALRCRWMTRKRRKQEEYNNGKKVKDRKDKLAESSLKANVHNTSQFKLSSYPLYVSQPDQIKCMPSGAVSGTTRHILEENNMALGQISANLSTLKLQENVELLFRTRNNITTILNEMKSMPGIMSQMPPLPVYMNEELVKILPSSSQHVVFGSSNGMHMKQEPRC